MCVETCKTKLREKCLRFKNKRKYEVSLISCREREREQESEKKLTVMVNLKVRKKSKKYQFQIYFKILIIKVTKNRIITGMST